MSRIARKAWTFLAVVTIEVARLFPGVGRLRGRVDRRDGAAPSDLDRTLRRFRRAVWALWAVNVLLAVTLVSAAVVAAV